MQFLTGKDYPNLCTKCRSMVDQVVELVETGPDVDANEEAPCDFVYDHGLFCGGHECVHKEAVNV